MARDKSKDAKAQGAAEPEPDDVKYGAAVDEIEQILASIDRDEIDLDELGQKVERAVDLLKVCRAKLKSTEARVTQVLKDLAQEEAAAESATDDADEGATKPSEPEPPSPSSSRKKKPAADDDEELPF